MSSIGPKWRYSLFIVLTLISLGGCQVAPTTGPTLTQMPPEYGLPLANFQKADINVITSEFIDQYAGQYVVFDGWFLMSLANPMVKMPRGQMMVVKDLRSLEVANKDIGRNTTVIWCDDDRDLGLPLISMSTGAPIRVYAYILPPGKDFRCKSRSDVFRKGLGQAYAVLIKLEARK